MPEICELMWIKTLLEELWVKIQEPMKLFFDNEFAINIAHNLIQHDRSKHIEIDRHFIKEKIEVEIICSPNILTKLQ